MASKFSLCFQKGIRSSPALDFEFTAYTHCSISFALYRYFKFSPKFKLQTKGKKDI